MSDSWLNIPFSELPFADGNGINPYAFPDERFELYSIPAHEQGVPQVVSGNEIGSNKQVVSPGMTLLGKINPRINRTWVVKEATNLRQIASTEWIGFRKSAVINPYYLMYFMQQTTFREFLASNASGVGGSLMRIKPGTLRDFPFRMPGTRTQSHIVEKIEELFTDLDAGVAELKAAQKKLARYRQSLLKAAVEGALTAEWRAERARRGEATESGAQLLARILVERRARWEAKQLAKFKEQGKAPPEDWKGKFPEPPQLVFSDLPSLPNEWEWARVDATGDVQLGRQRAPQYHTGANMVPYLRVANVFENRIDISDVMQMHFSPAEEETFRLHAGDILLNEGQSLELVGRPAIYRDELPRACFTNTLIRYRVESGILPEYALMVFLSNLYSGRFQKIATITTNIAHLGAGRFASVEFPVPPTEEQLQIVHVVGEALQNLDRQRNTIELALKQSAAQRKNILKAAFSGQLVPQAPNDEPASVLLERIRAERDEKSKAAKPAKAKKKASKA